MIVKASQTSNQQLFSKSGFNANHLGNIRFRGLHKSLNKNLLHKDTEISVMPLVHDLLVILLYCIFRMPPTLSSD